MITFAQIVRRCWFAVTGQSKRQASAEVILHDPGAQRPRDLDDPYSDPKVQSRIGSVAKNAAKERQEGR